MHCWVVAPADLGHILQPKEHPLPEVDTTSQPSGRQAELGLAVGAGARRQQQGRAGPGVSRSQLIERTAGPREVPGRRAHFPKEAVMHCMKLGPMSGSTVSCALAPGEPDGS